MYGESAMQCLDSKHEEDEEKSVLFTWKGGGPEFHPSLHSRHVLKACFGKKHGAILTRDYRLYTVGSNLYGQLGNGGAGGSIEEPCLVDKFKDVPVIDVDCGANHTAAIVNDGSVYCWGDGSHGQCAKGFIETILEPTLVCIEEVGSTCEHGIIGPGRKVAAINVSCGDVHTAVISSDKEIWTWGRGFQLGLGNIKETCHPMKIDFLGGKNVIGISCGAAHTVALVERKASSLDLSKVKVHDDRPSTCSICNKELYSYSEESDMCVISDDHKCPLGLELSSEQNNIQETKEKSDSVLINENCTQTNNSSLSSKLSKHSIFNEEDAKVFLSRQLLENSTNENRSAASQIGSVFSNIPFRSTADKMVENVKATFDKFRFVSSDTMPDLESISDSLSELGSRSGSTNSLRSQQSEGSENISKETSLSPKESPKQAKCSSSEDIFKTRDVQVENTNEDNTEVTVGVTDRYITRDRLQLEKTDSNELSSTNTQVAKDNTSPKLNSNESLNSDSVSSDTLSDVSPDHFKMVSSNLKNFSVGRARSQGSFLDSRYSLTVMPNKVTGHTPIVCLDTEVWAWGSNKHGQLGLGDMLERIQPSCVKCMNNRRVIKVCSGSYHTVVLTSTGQVYSWGLNKHGQLGQSDTDISAGKIKLISSQFMWDIAVGDRHTVLVADMGPQPEVYYCGIQHPSMSSPCKKIDHKVQPIRLTDFRRKVGWVKQVVSGGDICGCIADKTIESLSATLYEVSASERSFYYQVALMAASVCKPILLSESFLAIEATTYGMSLKVLLESFINLSTNIGINSIEVTRAIQGLHNIDNVFMIGHHEEFMSLFQHYSKSFCDTLAVGGFDSIGQIISSIFEKSKESIAELADISKVEIAEDSTKTLCRLLQLPLQRLGTYAKLVNKLANASSEGPTQELYRDISRCWEDIKQDAKEERSLAETTRKFWDTCSPKFADSLKLPNRRLLFESRAHPLVVPNAGRFSMHWLLLFNDAFVHAQYATHQTFPLATVWAETVKETDSVQNAFTLKTPEEVMIFSAPSAPEKVEWLLRINQAIQVVITEKRNLRTHKNEPMSLRASLRRRSSQSLFSLPAVRQACHVYYRIPELKGARYEGTWSHGKMHGDGELILPDSSKYAGKFKQGLYHGHGTLRTPVTHDKADVYEGHWRSGKKHGLGKISYANGDVYEGYFKANQRHGHGVFKQGNIGSAQASVYIGEWKADKRNGYGVLDDIVEGEKYMGMWLDDCRHGKGVTVTLDGMYYEGSFSAGRMTGFGVVIMQDDTCFEGEFSDKQQPYGKGSLILPNGDRIVGQFSGKLTQGLKINGTFQRKDNLTSEKRVSFHSTQANFENYGKFAVHPDNKWEDIFSYCRSLLGMTPEGAVNVNKAWEMVAIMLNACRKSSQTGDLRHMDDSLEKIPPHNTGHLIIEGYQNIKAYLIKAFDTPYHPLGKLLEGLVDVYRATYVGVGANVRLLNHAIAEVKSFVKRIYEVVRVLFPDLPADGHPVQIYTYPEHAIPDDCEEDEQEEIVSSTALLHPLLLPKIYPVLFTLYALHNEADNEKYVDRITRWNKQSDMALMSYLGMEEKFWLFDVETSTATRLSTVRDKSYIEPIEMLQQISTTFCPSDKLNIIQKAFNAINKTVQLAAGKEHMWSMDDLFPVFEYVVIRARIQHLGAEINFIQDLMETHLEFGELGIMFTTLKACYFQIQLEKINT